MLKIGQSISLTDFYVLADSQIVSRHGESASGCLLQRVCPPADRYSGTGPGGYKLFGGGKLAFQSQMTQETLGGTERRSRQRKRLQALAERGLRWPVE